MKLTVANVEQNSLLPVIAQEWSNKEKYPKRSCYVFQRAEKPRHTLGMDSLFARINAPGFKLLINFSDVTDILFFIVIFQTLLLRTGQCAAHHNETVYVGLFK